MYRPPDGATPPLCAICGAAAQAQDGTCPVCGAPLAGGTLARPEPPAEPDGVDDTMVDPPGTDPVGTQVAPWRPGTPAPTSAVAPTPMVAPSPAGHDGPRSGTSPVASGPPRFALVRATWNKRWVRRAVAVVMLLGVASPLVADDLRTRSRLDTTRERLHTTELRLTRTRADLDGTRRELASTRTELDARTRERDDLRARLDATNAELAGVRGSLSEAQSRLNLQAGQIATLKSCLSGVAQALIYVADGYYGLAASALEAVRVACEQASELF